MPLTLPGFGAFDFPPLPSHLRNPIKKDKTMAKKSAGALLASIEKAAATEGSSGAKRGRKKGSKNRKASLSCDINVKDADKAIAVVGGLIRNIERATGGKFSAKAPGVARTSGAGRKKARKRK